MLTPPKPTFSSLWFTYMQRYEFVPVSDGHQLGTFADSSGQRYSLVLVAGATHGTCAWDFLPGDAKAGYLISRATYDALRSATLHISGTVGVNGQLYHLQASFSGEAELTQATVILGAL
jgi:hypothetical protein